MIDTLLRPKRYQRACSDFLLPPPPKARAAKQLSALSFPWKSMPQSSLPAGRTAAPNTVTPCPERPFPIVPLHTFGQRLATYYFSRSALESVVVWLRGHPEPWSQLHQSLREHLSRVRLRYLIRRRHMFNTREYTGHRLVTGMPPPAALKPFPVCFWRILSQRRPCDIVYRANTFHGCLSPSDVRLGGGGGISQNHNKTGAETHFSTDKYIFPFFPVGWHADSVERRLLQRVDCPQSL